MEALSTRLVDVAGLTVFILGSPPSGHLLMLWMSDESVEDCEGAALHEWS